VRSRVPQYRRALQRRVVVFVRALNEQLCALHESQGDWHWTTDVVGVIPALVHPDGSWEPMGEARPHDRECAKAAGIEADRIVDWPVR